MRPRFLCLGLLALLASPALAATVTTSGRLDPTSPGQINIRAVRSETNLLGFGGPSDTGIDAAFASADLTTGEMRFLARDGRQTSDVSVYERRTGASASAEIAETLTLFTTPEEPTYVATLGMDFEANITAFAGGFGQFYEDPAIGGLHAATVSFLFEVTVRNPQTNGSVLTNRSFGQARHNVVADVSWSDDATNYVVVDQPAFIPPNVEFGPDNRNPLNPTQVQEVRTVVDIRNEDLFRGYIEIDVLINGTYTLDFRGQLFSEAVGGAGTYSGISSLNTASLFVRTPDPALWTSDSGLFLTADSGPAPVPLPGSLGLAVLAASSLCFCRLTFARPSKRATD